MAHKQTAQRPKAGKPQPPRKRNSSFPIETEPLTSNRRDVSRLEDSRRRAILEKSQNAFQPVAYRTEPTVGEEEIKKHSTRTQRERASTPKNLDGGVTNDTDRDRLLQSLLPDYFCYIQNFHHYRNDVEKMVSGLPVPYLTRGTDSNKTELKQVYGRNNSKSDLRHKAGFSGYFRALPARNPKTATVAERQFYTGTKPHAAQPGSTKKNSKRTDPKKQAVEELCHGKPSTVEPRHQKETELPAINLENLPCSSVDAARTSFQSIQSELLPPGPLTTPDAASRRSSTATFLTSLDDVRVDVGGSVSSEDSSVRKGVVFKPYLSPFLPRFPHMKATTEWSSRRRENAKQEKRARSPATPGWQHYRILCDAFRPVGPSNYVQRSSSGQRRPRFVTSVELQYYFDVVTEMSMHLQMC